MSDTTPQQYRKTASDYFQDYMLRLLFIVMLCAGGYVLAMDYRMLQQQDGSSGAIDTLEPVPMIPVSPADQIRPYVPSSRPTGPGRIAPDLTPFNIPSDLQEKNAMIFRFDDAGTMLAFGTITPGTLGAFERALLGREGEIKEIVLHSPGGSVHDAIAMGRLIRKREMNTRVVANGYCASSCPLVFASGVERVAHETSWIGVHQVYTPPTTFGSIQDGMDQAQRISALCQTALVDFGVDPALWIKAMETHKDSLYVLTPEEMTELKLATEVIKKDAG
ncbi:MAG: hypothetical protein COA52_10565 [Hyphomicrobiales bacterium]|nr:MAG: hypothetical protein COA52_10565 [Hyphomicrobiales bacterium]